MVKPPAMPGDLDSIPGWEDPLEKEMTTHSSIPAWRIPRTEKPDRLQSVGWHRVGDNSATNSFFSLVAR